MFFQYLIMDWGPLTIHILTVIVWSTGLAYSSEQLKIITCWLNDTIFSGGTPHTYCGLTDHDVCCFVPDNAAPVGILPTPNRVKCGRKGFDSGKDGEAEFSEWPWHVSWEQISFVEEGSMSLLCASQKHQDFKIRIRFPDFIVSRIVYMSQIRNRHKQIKLKPFIASGFTTNNAIFCRLQYWKNLKTFMCVVQHWLMNLGF